MDVILIDSEKYIISWDDQRNGWTLVALSDKTNSYSLMMDIASKATRLWNYFESVKNG